MIGFNLCILKKHILSIIAILLALIALFTTFYLFELSIQNKSISIKEGEFVKTYDFNSNVILKETYGFLYTFQVTDPDRIKAVYFTHRFDKEGKLSRQEFQDIYNDKDEKIFGFEKGDFIFIKQGEWWKSQYFRDLKCNLFAPNNLKIPLNKTKLESSNSTIVLLIQDCKGKMESYKINSGFIYQYFEERGLRPIISFPNMIFRYLD